MLTLSTWQTFLRVWMEPFPRLGQLLLTRPHHQQWGAKGKSAEKSINGEREKSWSSGAGCWLVSLKALALGKGSEPLNI